VIKTLPVQQLPNPFNPQAKIPEYWPFSPLLFSDAFLKKPFFLFEDRILHPDHIEILFRELWREAVYYIPWPPRYSSGVGQIIFQPTQEEIVQLDEQMFISGGLYFNDQHEIFVHYHSDFFMANFSEEHAKKIFGFSLKEMFEDQHFEDCFTHPERWIDNKEWG
jgi:hypothetical protein